MALRVTVPELVKGQGPHETGVPEPVEGPLKRKLI